MTVPLQHLFMNCIGSPEERAIRVSSTSAKLTLANNRSTKSNHCFNILWRQCTCSWVFCIDEVDVASDVMQGDATVVTMVTSGFRVVSSTDSALMNWGCSKTCKTRTKTRQRKKFVRLSRSISASNDATYRKLLNLRDGMCGCAVSRRQDGWTREALHPRLDGHRLNILWRGGKTLDWLLRALLSNGCRNQWDHEEKDATNQHKRAVYSIIMSELWSAVVMLYSLFDLLIWFEPR